MADRNVSIRIGVTGQNDAKRAFDDVGKAGQDAFGKTASSMDAAGTAADRETQRLQRLAQAARQAADAQNAQAKFNAFMGIGTQNAGSARASAQVFEAAAKAQEDLAVRSAALRAQIDPLGAAQLKMNSAMANATQLFEAGAISEAEHAAAVAMAKSEYEGARVALKNFGAAGALGSTQTMALTAAIRHMIDATIAGRPPLQALAMESGNLSYGLSGSGGLMGALRGVGGLIAGLLSPTVLLVGGLVALGGAAIYAYASFRSGQKDLEQALKGVGAGAGTTVDRMNAIAEAASSSGMITVGAARDMEIAFAKTGRIGADNFSSLIELAQNYAATTGESIGDATKEVAKAFADPVKGANELNAKLGFLDDKTRQYIQTLVAQGDEEKAQKALLDAMGPSLDNAKDKVTLLGEAWNFVKRMASGAMDAMGHAISEVVNGPGLADRLKALQEERQNATTLGGQYVATPFGGTAFVPSRPLSQIDADIAAVRAKIDKANADAQALQAQNAARAESIAVGDLVNGLVPEVKQYQDLVNEQTRLQKDLANPLFRQHVADLDQTKQAYDAVTRAVRTYLTPAQKAQQLAELDIRALNAKTPAQKAEIAAERERLDLAGKAIPAAQAQALIDQAHAKALAEGTHALAEQSLAIDANTRASLDVANAWLKGAAAAMEMEARAKALKDTLRNGGDAGALTAKLLQEQIAQDAAQGAKRANDLNAQADAQKRLNDAIAAGTTTVEQAQRQMQVEQALAPLIVDQTLAQGDAKKTLTAIIDALRRAYGRLNDEQTRNAALGQIQTQKDQIAILQKQIEFASVNQSQGEVEIAQLQTKQQLVQRGIDLSSQDAQTILDNAAAIARLGQQLALAKSSTEELSNLTDTAFGHFSDLISQGKLGWKDWADAGKAAILDIDNELLKLALLNPLKNFLFGQNNATLSSVGGALGDILKSIGIGHAGGMAEQLAATRQAPIGLFRYAPRLHDGTFLGPDEVPAILQRGERVLNRDETRRYNGGMGARQPSVSVTIQTPSPAAFKASRTQIAADLARAVQMGMRGF